VQWLNLAFACGLLALEVETKATIALAFHVIGLSIDGVSLGACFICNSKEDPARERNKILVEETNAYPRRILV
jgi:hypothetical protein